MSAVSTPAVLSKASPRELHFYFGASLSFQGAEKEFGSFSSAGNPLLSFYFSKPHPFWNPLLSYDETINTFWNLGNNL